MTTDQSPHTIRIDSPSGGVLPDQPGRAHFPPRPSRQLSVVLPFPPSTNSLFTNRRGGRAKTTRYDRWIIHAGTVLAAHRPKCRFTGPVNLLVELVPPTKRDFDLSNYIKAPEDLLIRHGIIQDDSWKWVKDVRARIGEGFEGCRVTVTEWEGSTT